MARTSPQTSNHGWLSRIRGDLLGGTLAAVVALPLALAFGVASGLGAQAGLYGAVACGIFAALFGGTPGQISGPTGPMTVVVAGLIAANQGRMELVFGAIILAGLLQIILGLIKSGELVHYIPYPVISGFMSGIGLIIILVEIPPLFGLSTPTNALAGLSAITNIPEAINPVAWGIGLLTIAIIQLLPRLAPKIPATLVALIACTILTLVLRLDIPQVQDIGQIPVGLPMPAFPRFSLHDLLFIMVPVAISLALLGAIDSLLTSVVVDNITHRRHNSNKELIGQGIGNMVAGLFGGLPGAGATMRSVINIRNQGRSNLSGVIHGLILLAVLLGLGSAASQIPLACLAGILITVGIGIIDYRGLKSIGKASNDDVIAMLIVLGLTVFLDLVIAVLAGMALASFLFAKRLSDMSISQHGYLDTIGHLYDAIRDIPEEKRQGIYTYTFNGPLFFGEARNFNQVISELPEVGTLILLFENVHLVDQTGAFSLEDAIGQLEAKGVRVLCVGMSENVNTVLSRMGIFRKTPNICFNRFEDALESLAPA